MCTTSPATTGFSRAVDSDAMVRRPGLQAPPPLSPRFFLLYVFQSTHFFFFFAYLNVGGKKGTPKITQDSGQLIVYGTIHTAQDVSTAGSHPLSANRLLSQSF